ncbi:hypothetical protein CHARACLAT_015857 [Characodon lateralis]|uniref:Secreted protein n=1 Tax=Characodon lateralis TaxID=208331 RepID=A0ABU7E0U2_9TELE|nr:hypothetical protein [Characodon lateralis]
MRRRRAECFGLIIGLRLGGPLQVCWCRRSSTNMRMCQQQSACRLLIDCLPPLPMSVQHRLLNRSHQLIVHSLSPRGRGHDQNHAVLLKNPALLNQTGVYRWSFCDTRTQTVKWKENISRFSTFPPKNAEKCGVHLAPLYSDAPK